MKNILIYNNQIFDAEDTNTYEELNKSELYGFIVGEKYNFKTLSLESKMPIDVSYCIVSIKDDKIYMSDDEYVLSVKKSNSSLFMQSMIIETVKKNGNTFLKCINDVVIYEPIHDDNNLEKEELMKKIEEVDW